MISAWWLILIIPLSAGLGLVVAAMCLAAKWGEINVPTQLYWKDGDGK